MNVAPQSSAWRAWLLVFAAMWAAFAPAWAASAAFAPTQAYPVFNYETASSRAGALGEKPHLGFFGETTPERVPRVCANSGTASGSEVAAEKPALGVHVYLYAHANPVTFSDPSGNSVFASTYALAFSVYTRLLYMAVPAVVIVNRAAVVISNSRLYRFFQNISISSMNNSARLPQLIRQAQARYPDLKGWDNHHILPQYIRIAWDKIGIHVARPWYQIQVRIPNAYHQVIHNEIKDAIARQKLDVNNPRHVSLVLDAIEEVIERFPLN